MKRPLGNTGIETSVLGLGTVKLGRNSGVNYPQPFDLPSDTQTLTLLESARDLGINVVDTAPAYGTSEQRLGALLPGPRSSWVICTKAGEEFSGGRSVFDFSPAAITASVHRSLRDLRTDYLDLVCVHSDGDDLAHIDNGAIETLDRLKQAGKVRATGFSSKTVAGGLAAAAAADVVMITLNLQQTEELEVVQRAVDLGRGVLIKKPLGNGHLEARPNLEYVLGQSGVSCAVVGTLDIAHLRENAEVVATIQR